MAESDPKKQQMEYIAIGLLVVVALLVGMLRFKKKDVKEDVLSRDGYNKRWKEVEILEANIPKDLGTLVDYSVHTDRVPFKSPFEEEKPEEKIDEKITLPPMSFQGMVWNSKRPQAIIDNRVYDIGDVITVGSEEVMLLKVDKDGLYLRYKGKEFIVRPK